MKNRTDQELYQIIKSSFVGETPNEKQQKGNQKDNDSKYIDIRSGKLDLKQKELK